MNDREFINFLIKSYLSNAKNPHQATLDNTFANRLNDIADKLEKQEKVLSIIKEKNVNIASLKAYDLEEYNMVYENKLTEEEFELLKRYFGKNIQK